jgi:uroporphyrinogen decarboxylase
MRQAGRYMPAYQALRKRYGMLELLMTPDLACDITLQPIRAFDLDAAIIFADILTPLRGMGLTLEFLPSEGPAILNPVACSADVDALRVPEAEESVWFTLEAIQIARRELDPLGLPLIGFAGGPFTLAAYAIEGGGSRDYRKAKALMLGEPALWHRLLRKFSETVGRTLLAQARAGAQVLQLFDSWAGALSPTDYRECVLPHSRRAIEIAREAQVPIIHFGTNTGGLLQPMRAAGGDVVGVDWRVDLDTAWSQLDDDVAVQGNLDPVALCAPWEELKRRAARVLDQAGGRPGHIFNLGHGILPETPMDNVRRLVDFVHAYPGNSLRPRIGDRPDKEEGLSPQCQRLI